MRGRGFTDRYLYSFANLCSLIAIFLINQPDLGQTLLISIQHGLQCDFFASGFQYDNFNHIVTICSYNIIWTY